MALLHKWSRGRYVCQVGCVTKRRKRKYRLRHWPDYNSALVRRGSLTLRVDSRSLDSWLSRDGPARRGRRRLYTDAAILCCLMLRATEGLARSLLGLLNPTLPTPDYTTLSRHARLLCLGLAPDHAGKIRHLVIDSTGLKLYGEGEWQVRAHGWAKRRTWRKPHLSVDASTHRVAAALVTEKEVIDSRVLPRLLGQSESAVGRASMALRSGRRGRSIIAARWPRRQPTALRRSSPASPGREKSGDKGRK